MTLFVLWLGVMFPLVFSPGPANIVFAMSGAKVGLKRSLPLIAGVDIVFLLKSIIVGFGLGQVVQAYPNAMNVLQLIGAAYLIYLGIKFIKSSTNKVQNAGTYLGFVDGLLVQLLNTKGWLMVFLMFTLFAEDAQTAFDQFGIWVLIFWLAVLNVSVHVIWVAMGELIAKLSSNPHYEKWLNIFYASSLIVVAGWLIIDNPIWR